MATAEENTRALKQNRLEKYPVGTCGVHVDAAEEQIEGAGNLF